MTCAPACNWSNTAATAAMPELNDTASASSRAPTTASNAAHVGVPSSREYPRSPPRRKFEAGTNGSLSGAPAVLGRPAATARVSIRCCIIECRIMHSIHASQLRHVAEQVRRRRLDRGWTLDVAAGRLGVSRRLLVQIEAGDAN